MEGQEEKIELEQEKPVEYTGPKVWVKPNETLETETEMKDTGESEVRDFFIKFNPEEFSDIAMKLAEARRVKMRGARAEKSILELLDNAGETKEVACKWMADIKEKKIVLVRTDTLQIVETRQMKSLEMERYCQGSLFPDEGQPIDPVSADEKIHGVHYEDDFSVCQNCGGPIRTSREVYKIMVSGEERLVCFNCYMILRSGLKDNHVALLQAPVSGEIPILDTSKCSTCKQADEPCSKCRDAFQFATNLEWKPEYSFVNKKWALEKDDKIVA